MDEEDKAERAAYYKQWAKLKKTRYPAYWKKRRAAQALWRRNKYKNDPIYRQYCLKWRPKSKPMKRIREINRELCPPDWHPGCICNMDALNPNPSCYIHGNEWNGRCWFCKKFISYKKPCGYCGCEAHLPPF